MENKTLTEIAYWVGVATPPISAGLGYLFGKRKAHKDIADRVFSLADNLFLLMRIYNIPKSREEVVRLDRSIANLQENEAINSYCSVPFSCIRNLLKHKLEDKTK